MLNGYIYLAGRVIGMGFERPLVKKLGLNANPTAVTTLYVGLGEVFFALIVLAQWLANPAYFAGITEWLPWALIPGCLYCVSFFTFIRAMRVGEVSLLTPLFASAFVAMYVYDVAAGYARLHPVPLLGVLLVSLGVAVLNPARQHVRSVWQRLNPAWLLRQPGALLMLANAFAMATGRFFDKTLVDHNLDVAAPPVLYALVVNAPTVIVGLVILAFTRQVSCLPLLVKSRWQVAFSLTLLGQGAFLLALMSLDYFPPSVIEPVTQLGVFIAVYLGGRWFGEKVRTRWLPSAMVVAGAALLLI